MNIFCSVMARRAPYKTTCSVMARRAPYKTTAPCRRGCVGLDRSRGQVQPSLQPKSGL